MTIAVVDYGMGNLRSVAKALEHVAGRARIAVSADPALIRAADRVVFPGVGALGDCMAELGRLGLIEALRDAIATKPVLGICLGMQALLERSEESGGTVGLGTIPGESLVFEGTMRDEQGRRFKVPHMGWNCVHQCSTHPMWHGIEQNSRFYFVHSYFVKPDDPQVVAATTQYGLEFVSAIVRNNLFAVQFHPEKSQHAGLTLLRNFVAWDGRCE